MTLIQLYYLENIKDVTVNCPKCKKPVSLIANYKKINECCSDCGYPIKNPSCETTSI